MGSRREGRRITGRRRGPLFLFRVCKKEIILACLISSRTSLHRVCGSRSYAAQRALEPIANLSASMLPCNPIGDSPGVPRLGGGAFSMIQLFLMLACAESPGVPGSDPCWLSDLSIKPGPAAAFKLWLTSSGWSLSKACKPSLELARLECATAALNESRCAAPGCGAGLEAA